MEGARAGPSGSWHPRRERVDGAKPRPPLKELSVIPAVERSAWSTSSTYRRRTRMVAVAPLPPRAFTSAPTINDPLEATPIAVRANVYS